MLLLGWDLGVERLGVRDFFNPKSIRLQVKYVQAEANLHLDESAWLTHKILFNIPAPFKIPINLD